MIVTSIPFSNHYRATAQTMKNITRTTARTATLQFENALDNAWLQVSSGAFDADSAIRQAVKRLSEQGIETVRYSKSGHVDTVETAVRRAIVTGVNQTAARLQEELADELGCDLVEVSAHAGARPEHAAWQGKIYSRSGQSEKYPEFRSATGYGTGAGLCGWNCRHTFGPYIEGSPRVWTDEKLAELNAPKYEYNGERLTEYEARQKEKYFDRQIHRWNREAEAMKAAGQDSAEARAKVKEWTAKKWDFLQNRVDLPLAKSRNGGIINKKLSDRVVDMWNNSDNVFHHEDIEKALESSFVGNSMSKYIQDKGYYIVMDYSTDTDGLSGEVQGKDIVVYANEHQNEMEVSSTIVHEVCHIRYGWDKTQEDEVNCRLMETMHTREQITEADIRSVVAFVRRHYSEYPEGNLYGYD